MTASKNTNPQDAMVGDLIMWTSNCGGFYFGKIISFMKDGSGRPVVKPIRLPWTQTRGVVGKKWFKHPAGGIVEGQDGPGWWMNEYGDVHIEHPLRYGKAQQSGYNWMVIAYGPNNPKARTVSELHPIAKAKQQFAELEAQIASPF